MNAFCPVCRTAVTPENAVVLGAFGKAWFTVHQGACHEATQRVIRSGALVALGALRTVLKTQAPTALKVVESAATGLRLFRGMQPRG